MKNSDITTLAEIIENTGVQKPVERTINVKHLEERREVSRDENLPAKDKIELARINDINYHLKH